MLLSLISNVLSAQLGMVIYVDVTAGNCEAESIDRELIAANIDKWLSGSEGKSLIYVSNSIDPRIIVHDSNHGLGTAWRDEILRMSLRPNSVYDELERFMHAIYDSGGLDEAGKFRYIMNNYDFLRKNKYEYFIKKVAMISKLRSKINSHGHELYFTCGDTLIPNVLNLCNDDISVHILE